MAGGKRRTGAASAAASGAASGGGAGASGGSSTSRRNASRRRRAEPNRYADDRPEALLTTADGSAAAAAASSAGAANAAASGTVNAAEPAQNASGAAFNEAAGFTQKGADGALPDGAIAHRVSVLPALRYVRPGYLQSAVDTLEQQQRQKAKKGKEEMQANQEEQDEMDVDAPAKMQTAHHDDGKDSQSCASRSPSRRSSSAMDDSTPNPPRGKNSTPGTSRAQCYPSSDPRSPSYIPPLRRQEILAQLRTDPALTPLFGPSIGLLHKARRAFKENSGGIGGAAGIGDDIGVAAGGASGSTLRPDWDGVRYNQFYYPQDYVNDEDTSVDQENNGADTAKGGAAPADAADSDATPRKRLRLAPGVLPVSRAVTVLAMTKDTDPASATTSAADSEKSVSYRYMAVGDTAGFVTLYATEPIISQVGRLATTSSIRDYESELAIRSRPQKLKRIAAASVATSASGGGGGSRHGSDDEQAVAQRRGGIRFAGYRTVIDSSRPLVAQMPNAVEAMAFNCTGTKIAVASKFEVELFDCLTGTMLWSCPTSRLFGANSTAAVSISDKGRLVLAEGASKMARRAPLKLSFHPTCEDGDIVAGYEFDVWNKKDQEEEDIAGIALEDRDMSLVSPMLQFATSHQKNVSGMVTSSKVKVRGIIPSAEDTGLPFALGSRAMAIHDEFNPSRMLMVVINNNPRADDVEKDLAWRKKNSNSGMQPFPHLQELLLVDASSPSFKVLHRTVLPSRPGSKAKIVTVEALCQSLGGTYTAAATSCKGGIRLYRTEGLVHLATYGEGIKLHSSTIMWQDIFIIKMGNKKGRAEEREDELLLRTADSPTNSEESASSTPEAADYTDLMLVGVPGAFREPIDLNDRIHIWDLADVGWGGTKLPAITLIAPPKSNGIASLLYDGRPGSSVGDASKGGGGGRFIISTQSGDCRQFGSKMVSEWPGRMYPAGYIVLDDNVEYVEDEDELDIVVDYHPIDLLSQGSSDLLFGIDSPEKRSRSKAQVESADDDLKKALEASMYDADVDVLGVDTNSYNKSSSTCLLSAQPESHLKEHIDSSNGLVGNSTDTQMGESEFDAMSLLPSAQGIKELADKNRQPEESESGDLETETKEVSNKGPGKRKRKGGRARGKRPGTGNKFEALLKEMVDPKLQAIMTQRERWSNGEGSALRQKAMETVASSNDTGNSPACEACLGRPVHHRCGSRLNPVAVERAEEERRLQVEKEKLRRKVEGNRKRREVKRQKLLEEQERSAEAMRLLQEEEQQQRERQRERLRLDALARQEAVARQEAAQMQQDALVLMGQGSAAAPASHPPIPSAPQPYAPGVQDAALASQAGQGAFAFMGQRPPGPSYPHSAATMIMPSAPVAAAKAGALAGAPASHGPPGTNHPPPNLTPPPPTKPSSVVVPTASARKSPQEEEQERQNVALQLLGMAPMRSAPPSAPAPAPNLPTQPPAPPSSAPYPACQAPVAGVQGNGYFPSALPPPQQEYQARPPVQNPTLSALDILAHQSLSGSGTSRRQTQVQAQQQPPVQPSAASAALLQMASIASEHQPTQASTTGLPTSSQPASQPLGGINVAPQGERSSPPTSSLPLKKRDPMHNDDSGAT